MYQCVLAIDAFFLLNVLRRALSTHYTSEMLENDSMVGGVFKSLADSEFRGIYSPSNCDSHRNSACL